MKLNSKQIKAFRTEGHSLSPIVTVADRGLTETVIDAIHEALDFHELIKVKVRQERDVRAKTCEDICKKTGALEVQRIGMVLLIYKASEKSKKKSSKPGTKG